MADFKLWVTYALPAFSVLVLLGYISMSQPAITGFAAINITEEYKELDADINLQTYAGEVLPDTTKVAITLDRETAFMTLGDFIRRTGEPFNYTKGKLAAINYEGYGFGGNFTYSLPLSAFNIFRKVKPGEHTIKMQLIYLQHVLLEKEEAVVVK